jgi:epoxyqueuosine reductase
MIEELRGLLLSQGASLVGFADITALPESSRGGFGCAVSIAVALVPPVILEITRGPTLSYYADYNRVNKLLAELGVTAARFLREKGFDARMVDPTTEEYDRETNSVSFQHKTAATRAGIGWIGKCALLVTREYGSAIRLGTVLSNAPLPAAKPIETSLCGACMDCVTQCPAGAPTGREWKVGMERENIFNAMRCRKKAKELSGRIGLHKTICGICIAVCPWTQEYVRGRN